MDDRVRRSEKSLEENDASGVFLEAIQPKASRAITESVNFLTFGIGAGRFTDGQLLILHDLLGLYPNFRPKFARCSIPHTLEELLSELSKVEDLVKHGRSSRNDGIFRLTVIAVNHYIKEVRERSFPSEEYSYLPKILSN